MAQREEREVGLEGLERLAACLDRRDLEVQAGPPVSPSMQWLVSIALCCWLRMCVSTQDLSESR